MAAIVKFQKENYVDFLNLELVKGFIRNNSNKPGEKDWLTLIFEIQNYRVNISNDEPQFEIIMRWLEKNSIGN